MPPEVANKKEPPRKWRDIVNDIREEKDQERLAELVRELDEALVAEDPEGRRTLHLHDRIIMSKGDPPKR